MRLGPALAALLAAAPQVSAPPRSSRDAAIGALHARAAAATPGSPEAARISKKLERIGAAYLAEGDVGRATELLSEAYALDEENGLVLAQLTLCYVRAEDYAFARFYLRLAEERASRAPPEIYAVLGDVYFGLHRLDDAVYAWGESVRLGGADPDLLRRLARARDELAVSRGQRSLAFAHFQVFADPAVRQETALQAGEDLEAAYVEQVPLLGVEFAAPQVVILYAGRDYFALASVPDWASGLYDGKIRVSMEGEAVAPGSSREILAHELAHALIRSAAGDRAPAWFHEGLAQWCAGRRIPVRDLRLAVGPVPAASLEALDEGLRRGVSRPALRASYAHALSLVEFLIDARGRGAIACILARLAGTSGSFVAAMLAETGLSQDQLIAAWKRWAQI